MNESATPAYLTHADLGGQPGHGAVTPEPEGELFHAAWEPRALAVTLAAGALGAWNIDISRATRETLPDYARLSYYEIWFHALEKLLAARAEAVRRGVAAGRTLRAPDVAAALAWGSPTERPATSTPRFRVGDRVRTRAERVPHHTRLPGYAHGMIGTVERVHGVHVFADTNAHDQGEQPQWLYGVVFDGAELWGAGAARGLQVALDAWEPTLSPA
ncbi:MAG TPA: nitrile hydratase subunit beta [Burkholderiaceae bacterium]|nr:nitrile hydratase subunit beta [Burkholderiaceae bacterium]